MDLNVKNKALEKVGLDCIKEIGCRVLCFVTHADYQV